MAYSLTFGPSGSTRNTWTDWGLIPESPPVVDPPSPNTNFVDIPGRQEGPIDLSKVPWGYMTYAPSSGSWNFVKVVKTLSERKTAYEAIRGWLHGRSCKVVLEEDPNHYYMGSFTVGPAQLGSNLLRVQIGYVIRPVRYNTNGTIDTNYVQTT